MVVQRTRATLMAVHCKNTCVVHSCSLTVRSLTLSCSSVSHSWPKTPCVRVTPKNCPFTELSFLRQKYFMSKFLFLFSFLHLFFFFTVSCKCSSRCTAVLRWTKYNNNCCINQRKRTHIYTHTQKQHFKRTHRGVCTSSVWSWYKWSGPSQTSLQE